MRLWRGSDAAKRTSILNPGPLGRPEAPGFDAVLLDLVAQDAEAGVQDLGRLALVAPGLAQGLGDEFPLQVLYLGGQAPAVAPGSWRCKVGGR